MQPHVKPPVKVALIGAGLIGETHSLMLKQVAQSTEGSVRMVAIYDPAVEQAERIASYWPESKVAPSVRSIYDDAAIDAVWICTPTRFHRELVRRRGARRQACLLREAAGDELG